MRFKIDWVSLIAGGTFTVFALIYFVLESNFPSTTPWGIIYGGAISNGAFFFFLRYLFGGLIFGGAFTWTGLLSEFYGIFSQRTNINTHTDSTMEQFNSFTCL